MKFSSCLHLMLMSSLVGCAGWQPAINGSSSPEALDRGFDVLHYDAEVEPDINAKTLRGSVVVHWTSLNTGLTQVALDVNGLELISASEAGQGLQFEQLGRRLIVHLHTPASIGERRALRIEYRGKASFGLQIYPDRQQTYSIFSTSQWLPTIDAPDERATLALTIVLPSNLVVAANGEEIDRQTLPNGTTRHHWRLSQAAPSYTYGFAAGPFNEVRTRRHGIELHYLAAELSTAQLQDLFENSADMLKYFQRRAGIGYPGRRYAQALVVDTIGQEMSGLSVLSEEYGRRVLAEPRAQTLIAHEIAHQWWGNHITCRNWNHFWLNEGFATFLAATYMEHRFGTAEYQRLADGWQQRLQKLRDERADKPLVFPDWNRPSGNDRAVVYQKGAYVLHLLREHLGERVFWRGIRDYTRRYAGTSVTTDDFQRAMEESSSRDLQEFFDKWVYARS